MIKTVVLRDGKQACHPLPGSKSGWEITDNGAAVFLRRGNYQLFTIRGPDIEGNYQMLDHMTFNVYFSTRRRRLYEKAKKLMEKRAL